MKQKGITLVALVITVIVLLILAGTAISIAVNGGDIFGKASQAREAWNNSVAEEQTKVDEVLSILNTITTAQIDYPEYTVGQTVTLGTGENAEEFYVIEDSDRNTRTVKLLTKYCVNTTNNKQDADAEGVYFDSDYSKTIYENNTEIKELIDGNNGYVKALEARWGNTVESGRLMGIDEIVALGTLVYDTGDSVENQGYSAHFDNYPAFLNGSYWLKDNNLQYCSGAFVYCTELYADSDYHSISHYQPDDSLHGLRPLIIVDKTKI